MGQKRMLQDVWLKPVHVAEDTRTLPTRTPASQPRALPGPLAVALNDKVEPLESQESGNSGRSVATPSTEPWIQKEQLTPWDLRLWGPAEPTSPPHFTVTPKGRALSPQCLCGWWGWW